MHQIGAEMCGEPPPECRLCLPEYTPIFFLKHQKENAPCTVEKKKFRDELAHEGPTHPKRGADRYALPTKSRSLLPAAPKVHRLPKCIPASAGMAFIVVQIGHSLLLSPLPLPLILRGVSKGEGRSLPLCVVSRGCGGKSKSPCVSL